jgi:transposase-like protein
MTANVDLTNPIFHDEDKAREVLEAVRWPNGPVCPHCGNADPEAMPLVEGKKRSHRPGLRYCNACKGQFTVTVGTVFERSKIPLSKWWLAMHLMGSSKKGISAHQLMRNLGLGSYRTAWFMAHRIREAMKDINPAPMGGHGKYVEADSSYIGGREKNKHVGKRNRKNIGGAGKQTVHTLVERGGAARSEHIANVSGETLRPIVVKHVSRKSILMTDTGGEYMALGKEFARHEAVDHSKDEYVRAEAHSNTVEGYFAILKRGVIGTFHHISKAHLHRYLTEFDFRYTRRASLGWTDADRAKAIAEGIEGKRLTYRRPDEAAHA